MKYLYSFLLFVCLLTADRALGQEEMEEDEIFKCAEEGSFFCVQDAIEGFGAGINVRDGYGETLIRYAVQGGHVGIVRMLLDKGADRENQNVPLLVVNAYSLVVCRPEITSMLLSAGEDVNAANLGGETPLYLSIIHAYFERDEEEMERCIQVVRTLLDAGADVDQLNEAWYQKMRHLLGLGEDEVG